MVRSHSGDMNRMGVSLGSWWLSTTLHPFILYVRKTHLTGRTSPDVRWHGDTVPIPWDAVLIMFTSSTLTGSYVGMSDVPKADAPQKAVTWHLDVIETGPCSWPLLFLCGTMEPLTWPRRQPLTTSSPGSGFVQVKRHMTDMSTFFHIFAMMFKRSCCLSKVQSFRICHRKEGREGEIGVRKEERRVVVFFAVRCGVW